MANLVGRYIKVLRASLGGKSNMYKVDDYLKIEKETSSPGIYIVEHAGTLSLTFGKTNRVSCGDVEIMPIGWKPEVNHPKLSSFPSTGVCWNPTQELLDYLKDKTKYDNLREFFKTYKGLAWSTDRVWGVVESSGQPPYDIEQLKPFFKVTPKEPEKIDWEFVTSPITDHFEIGKYYYVRESSQHSRYMITKCEGFNTLDKQRINGPYLSNMNGAKFDFSKSNTPWINSGREVCLALEEDVIWLDNCIKAGKFVKKKDKFPEKWCIKPTPDIYLELNSFLRERKDEWKHYDKDWNIESTKHWFHYPPASSHTHSELSVQPGYIEITTEQFIKQFKIKQNEQKSRKTSNEETCDTTSRESGERTVCKIHRPNLEIRPGGTIRADSFRCSKSKISIRG